MFCLYSNFYFNFLKIKNFNIFISKYLKQNNNHFVYDNLYFLGSSFKNRNIINNNNFDFLFKYNKNYYYNLNKNNSFLLKKLVSILNTLFFNRSNLLFLDSSYKMVLPFYNYIFNTKTLNSNKSFFFIKKDNLTRFNWFYYFLENLSLFNINLLVILDYFFFKNFLSILKRFNKPLISLINEKIENIYIDYYLFINNFNKNISKFFLFNLCSSLFFKNYNYSLLKLKNKFIFNYKIFFKKIN